MESGLVFDKVSTSCLEGQDGFVPGFSWWNVTGIVEGNLGERRFKYVVDQGCLSVYPAT